MKRASLRGSLAVIWLYVVARGLVYGHVARVMLEDVPLDLNEDFSAALGYKLWLYRDAFMSIPRLLGFAASLWVMSRARALSDWNWRAAPAGAGAIAAATVIVFMGQRLLMGFSWEPSPTRMIVYFAASTLPVAYFEEAAFRGALLDALLGRMRPVTAALLSSALFTVWHVGAQPLWGWPMIFVCGAGFAAARLRGLGLHWLALAHWTIDFTLSALFTLK